MVEKYFPGNVPAETAFPVGTGTAFYAGAWVENKCRRLVERLLARDKEE
jgi:hypothetical protein